MRHSRRRDPVGQGEQALCGRGKAPDLLLDLFAAREANTDHNGILVDVETRAALVDHFHSNLLFARCRRGARVIEC